MPVFGDCEGLDGDALQQCSQRNLLEYIYTNVKYPAEAKEKGVEGITVSEIIISEEGEVIEAEAARVEGVDPLLREAALEVVENLPRFRPGLHQGKAVKVSYYIPIRFQLD
jgi:protein TonB